jgi:uroporphyrinogen decarboxylase
MNSKERVLRAFHKIAGLPDRPPLQFDLCRRLTEHFQGSLGIKAEYALSYYEDLTYRISANAIRTALGSDCIVVGGTVPSSWAPVKVRDDVTLNEFGMEMKPTPLYVEVVKCPLTAAASVDDIAAYPFPDALAPGRFEAAKRDIERFGSDFFVIGDVELSIFELAWHLTGMQEYMMALAMEEPWIEALNDRVEAWTLGLAEQLVRLGVDALWFGEDLGSQTSTLISPDMWRERFKPRYARMIAALKAINPEVMIVMHSDGAVAPLIDDFIEMGIEVYNPVQPNVSGSDPSELARKYGGKINFFGGIDQQVLLPSGDLPALKAEIVRRAGILGARGGYLMAPAHIIQADTAPATVLAMIDAVRGLAK